MIWIVVVTRAREGSRQSAGDRRLILGCRDQEQEVIYMEKKNVTIGARQKTKDIVKRLVDVLNQL